MYNFVEKMIKTIKAASGMAIILLMAGSCIEKEDYPDIPRIGFESFTKIDNGLGYDDKGILTINFTDGDGDLGLAEYETYPPYDSSSMYYYNFFIRYYEQQEGEFVEVELPFTNNARFPLLNEDGSDKPLKGKLAMELFINNFSSEYDTIRFEAFITDRALNHSDTITTPSIIINKPN